MMTKQTAKRPELLAPAGNFETLHAALSSGADAVYFGCGDFHARSSAAAFQVADLPEIMLQVRRAGAKAYLALNILLYEYEIEQALELAIAAHVAGVDALIIQDLGFASLVKNLVPGLALHASTQTAAIHEGTLRTLSALGIERVILPRELALAEITEMTDVCHRLGMESEVFVHGALCVALSGHCSLSRLRGGRSANRGACAGPCRLNWTLLEDGKVLKNKQPLLSPKDQSAFSLLPLLQEAGVDSLKIEGRLRTPLYVSTTVKLYQSALLGETVDEDEALLAYNRGGSFTSAFMENDNGLAFLSGNRPGNAGLRIGVIVGTNPTKGWLDYRPERFGSAAMPSDGDVLAIRHVHTDEELASAPVTQIKERAGIVSCRGFHPAVLDELKRGDIVYRMTDIKHTKSVADTELPRLPLNLTLELTSGFYVLKATCSVQESALGVARLPVEDRPALAEERILQQMRKTGSTPFTLEEFVNLCEAPVTLAISGVNQLRREAIEDLLEQMRLPNKCSEKDAVERVAEVLSVRKTETVSSGNKGQRKIRCYYPAWQHTSEVPQPNYADTVALPADELAAYFKKADFTRKDFDVRPVAVLPPNHDLTAAKEDLQILRNFGIQEVLCPTASQASDPLLAGFTKIGADVGLNILNSYSLRIASEWNLSSIMLSPELSSNDLNELLGKAELTGLSGLTPLEIFVYGRQRAMYMKHCPVGLRVVDCRRCAGHHYLLVDESNYQFPLLCHPEGGCRAEILAAEPTVMNAPIDYSGDIILRFTFVDETVAEQESIIEDYLSKL